MYLLIGLDVWDRDQKIEVKCCPDSRLGAGPGFSVGRVQRLVAVLGLVSLLVSAGTSALVSGLSRRLGVWGLMLSGSALIGRANYFDSSPFASPCSSLWFSVVGLSVARHRVLELLSASLWFHIFGLGVVCRRGSALFSALWFGSELVSGVVLLWFRVVGPGVACCRGLASFLEFWFGSALGFGVVRCVRVRHWFGVGLGVRLWNWLLELLGVRVWRRARRWGSASGLGSALWFSVRVRLDVESWLRGSSRRRGSALGFGVRIGVEVWFGIMVWNRGLCWSLGSTSGLASRFGSESWFGVEVWIGVGVCCLWGSSVFGGYILTDRG